MDKKINKIVKDVFGYKSLDSLYTWSRIFSDLKLFGFTKSVKDKLKYLKLLGYTKNQLREYIKFRDKFYNLSDTQKIYIKKILNNEEFEETNIDTRLEESLMDF